MHVKTSWESPSHQVIKVPGDCPDQRRQDHIRGCLLRIDDPLAMAFATAVPKKNAAAKLKNVPKPPLV